MEHNELPAQFPAPMDMCKAYRNKTVINNAATANCPNRNVNIFIVQSIKRLLIDFFVNINMLRSVKRLNSSFPVSVR